MILNDQYGITVILVLFYNFIALPDDELVCLVLVYYTPEIYLLKLVVLL